MEIPRLLPDSHPLLAQTMPHFDFKTEDAPALDDLLRRAMAHYRGYGLAANQIGIAANACAVTFGDDPNREVVVMFNPLISWQSTDTAVIDEGCLTFEGLWLPIRRPRDIQVTFQDAKGARLVRDLTGFDARVVLHETDHLLGVLYTSRVSRLKLQMAKKRAKKAQKKT